MRANAQDAPRSLQGLESDMENFDCPLKAANFADSKGMSWFREKKLHEMSVRELVRLRLTRQWCLGIRSEMSDDGVTWKPVDREFSSIEDFHKERVVLESKLTVRINYYYCHQLGSHPGALIHLEPLDRASLDTQLKEYTGDNWGSDSFENENDPHHFSLGSVVVHKKSKQRFFIPPAPMNGIY
jgi:hypothetical protein